MYQYNPYTQPNILPQQQVLRANGKASIAAIRMQPNSSVLVMDTTAPMVWLCVSDDLGNVTPTAYDITPHKDPEPVSVDMLDERLAKIEKAILLMEERYGKSNDADANGEQFITSQADVGNAQKRRKSASVIPADDGE